MSRELHNMSVPSTSRVFVQCASLEGARYRVDLTSGRAPSRTAALQKRIARSGWATAASILQAAGVRVDARPEAVARRFEQALVAAGVPPVAGVFLDDTPDDAATVLDAAAALAVLARRSGPLYLPSRRFEPSLVRLTRTVLFFPTPLTQASPADGASR